MNLQNAINFAQLLMIYILLVWHLFGFVLQTPQQTNLQNWQLAKDQDGIRLSHRLYAGTTYREVRGVMEVPQSPESLLRLIKDEAAGTGWINRMAVFETISTVSEQEWYTYAELSIPFPFQNRDLVSHNLLSQTVTTTKIDLISVPDYLPEKQDKVRIKKSAGFWQFTTLGSGRTEVVYQFYTEPNIALPRWFTEPLVLNGIHKTMKNLREYVKQEKYKYAEN
jgi:hypothetical protein